VPDDERGHGGHTGRNVPVQEVGEVRDQVLVDPVGRRHEIRPVEERPGHGHAVRAQHTQFLGDQPWVVVPPHQWATGP
jgi:hypothetical protein